MRVMILKRMVDIFETPVTVTPPTGNFKNLKLFKNSLKILTNVYFWGGNERLLLGIIIGLFGVFGVSFSVAGRVLGLRGSGGP